MNGLLTFLREYLLLKINGCRDYWVVIAPEFTYAAYRILIFHYKSNKAVIISDNSVAQQTEVTLLGLFVLVCLRLTQEKKAMVMKIYN